MVFALERPTILTVARTIMSCQDKYWWACGCTAVLHFRKRRLLRRPIMATPDPQVAPIRLAYIFYLWEFGPNMLKAVGHFG